MENQWVINPYFYQVWVTYGTKTNTASEFTHRFSTVEGFFATQKCSILVTHRFSMYAWVTYGEKEIKRDLLSPIAPKLYSYGLTLIGYKYNSK